MLISSWNRSGNWQTINTGASLQIAIKGILPTSATLSDLDLQDGDGNAVALSPGFAAGTTSYTASVSRLVAEITVTPTRSDSNATFVILDGSDATLGQPVVLAAGDNTIKVRVTSENGDETVTYTVVVTRAATPVTARFENLPAGHDGRNRFTVDLVFSEEVTATPKALRKTLIKLSGGRVVGARQLEPPSNLRWRITISPGSRIVVKNHWTGYSSPYPEEDIHIRLMPNWSCSPVQAGCTPDGRSLERVVRATVPGTPALSVTGAHVREGPNAVLPFKVRLNRAAPGTVTVNYRTRNGTATAGADYTAVSGTLTFPPGETLQTVEVPVLDDAHDEERETLFLKLSRARGARMNWRRREAAGFIVNSDPAQRAWLGRFGRTVAEQVLDAVEGRLGATRRAGVEVTLAGRALAGTATRDDTTQATEQRPSEWLGHGSEGEHSNAITERDLLTGSAFAVTGGTQGSGLYGLWGRGAVSRFDGREGDLTLDGEVASGMLGADWTQGRITAGVLLSHSRGEGGYRAPSGNGTVSSTLTGLYPWGRYAASERLSVWGVAGYGVGTLTLTPDGQGAAMRADMDLAMAALGARGVLMQAPEEGGSSLR